MEWRWIDDDAAVERVARKLAEFAGYGGDAITEDYERARELLRAARRMPPDLRKAGDALADAVSDIMADDPESVLHTWARQWREARDAEL
jgi:hypothetical protein